MCVWEDKRFLFLKNGRSGKILFPLFHELCTIHMLPATSSPQLCNINSKALTQGASCLSGPQVMAEIPALGE